MPFMTLKKLTLIPLTLLLTFVAGVSFAANFSGQADRTKIALGESLQITYSYNDEVQGQSPDFSLLKNNFDVLSYRPSSNRYQINGQVSIVNQWVLTLEPKSKGDFVIPPITFLGEVSEAIKIKVVEASAVPSSGQKIILETVIDKSAAYVQEQIKLSYRLYYSVDVEDLDLEELKIEDTTIKRLQDNRYRRRIDGVLYNVYEINYALLPQRSGVVLIPEQQWEARFSLSNSRSLFDRFGRYQTQKLRSKEKIVRVKAIPDAFPKDETWLPAYKITLEENFSQAMEDIEVGEPITRTLTLSAVGLESAQLPNLFKNPTPPNIKVYSEQPELSDNATDVGLNSSRKESAAIIASSGGEHKLPPIRIPWWNIEEDKLEWAELPAHRLLAKESSATVPINNAAPTSHVPTSEVQADGHRIAEKPSTKASPINTQWLWLLVASNLISLVLLALLFIRNKALKNRLQTPSETTANSPTHASPAWERLRDGVATNNDMKTYQAVIDLTREHFALNSVSELLHHAEKENKPQLSKALRSLENRLYNKANNEPVELTSMSALLKELSLPSGKNPSRGENLASFYR